MNKRLVYLIALFILIPQITFAAWWNPFSWNLFSFFRKTNPPSIQSNIPESDKESEQSTKNLKPEDRVINLPAQDDCMATFPANVIGVNCEQPTVIRLYFSEKIIGNYSLENFRKYLDKKMSTLSFFFADKKTSQSVESPLILFSQDNEKNNIKINFTDYSDGRLKGSLIVPVDSLINVVKSKELTCDNDGIVTKNESDRCYKQIPVKINLTVNFDVKVVGVKKPAPKPVTNFPAPTGTLNKVSILEPKSGIIIKPGDTIHVRVYAKGAESVLVAGKHNAVIATKIAPDTFTAEYETQTSSTGGTFELKALGATKKDGTIQNFGESKPILYKITLEKLKLTSIKSDPNSYNYGVPNYTVYMFLDSSIKFPHNLYVNGLFSDGRERDITPGSGETEYSKGIRFVSNNPNIASVTPNGEVTAHTLGVTTVTITHSDLPGKPIVYTIKVLAE